MKKLALVVLLLSTFSFAAKKPVPNSADYPINVHVIASHIQVDRCNFQSLDVIIDGKKYELAGTKCIAGYLILALGDYTAKLVSDEHPTTYHSRQTYEFLLPDNSTARFDVSGIAE